MGLLVLDGVIARSVSLGRIAYPELLGAGGLLLRGARGLTSLPFVS